MNEGQKVKEEERGEIDKKKAFIGFLVVVLVLTGIVFWGKEALPKFAERFKNVTMVRERTQGEVAGSSDAKAGLQAQREEVQSKIDEIKESVTKLKPDDIKNEAPVKKILSDLDDLAKQASESTKFLDIKGNICEEAKKRFCE